MTRLIWDSSALIKRYIPEAGSEAVDALFSINPQKVECSVLVYAEVQSIIRRKVNNQDLPAVAAAEALKAVSEDWTLQEDFEVQSISNQLVLRSLPLIHAHSINATDAIILRSCLDALSADIALSPTYFVASDRRLLRAAAHEALSVINPEAITPSEAVRVLER